MDIKILKLTQIIPNDLDPKEFYEYLEEYSEDDGTLWGFEPEEQQVIDEAWDEVKQDNFWNINISKLTETQAYKEYIKP